jgi:hypothetical protein
MSSRAQDIAQLEAQVRELERQVAALVPRRERAESKVWKSTDHSIISDVRGGCKQLKV